MIDKVNGRLPAVTIVNEVDFQAVRLQTFKFISASIRNDECTHNMKSKTRHGMSVHV